LDLSVRDFIDKLPEDSAPQGTGASYRVWYNPLTKNNNQEGDLNGSQAKGTVPEADGKDDDNDDEDENRDLLSEAVNSRQRREAQAPIAGNVRPELEQTSETSSDTPVDKLQVMDLHSTNPLLSYRGMVFRGSWAENIGTEMIFTRHDPESGLQVLRNLQEGVDLVAASSSRINFKQVQLEMRGAEPQKMSDYEWAEAADRRYKENGGLYVHVGSDKHGYRRPQANFLEDFEALKRKRGEMEGVTIITHETDKTDLYHEDFDEEQRRKKQLRDRGRNRNRALLQALQRGRGGRGKRRTGRAKGRGPPRGPMRSRVRQVAENAAADQELRPLEGTPPAWGQLESIPENELDEANDVEMGDDGGSGASDDGDDEN
jgi:hypothetical protein